MPVSEAPGQSQRYGSVTDHLYGPPNMRSTATTGISTASASAHRANSTPLPRPPDPSQSQATEHVAANARISAGDQPSGRESRQGRSRTNSTNPALAHPGSGHTSVRMVPASNNSVSADADVTMGNVADGADDTEPGADARTVYEDCNESPRGIQEPGEVPYDQSHGEEGDIETLCKQLAHRNQELQDENNTLLETIRALNEKHKQLAEDFEEDRRHEGLTNRLKRTVRPHGIDPVKRIDGLQNENEKLRQELSNALATANENKRRYKEYSDWVEQERKTTSKLQRTLDETRAANTSLQNAKLDAERKCGITSRENENLRRELQKTKGDLASVENIKNDIASQLNDATREAGRLSTKLDQKVALLESRTAELRTAETFLTKYDNVAGEEVTALAQEVNMKILDIAAAVSENIPLQAIPRPAPPLDLRLMEQVSNIIGPTLSQHLRNKDHSKDPTLVQLAIQAALVKLAETLFSTWPIPYNSALKDPFWTIYERMCAHEHQAIASRWRALTSKHFRGQYTGDYKELMTGMRSEGFDILTRILLMSGAPGQPSEVEPRIKSLARGDLDRLLELAANLAEKAKEQVSSTDYQLFYILPSVEYDERFMRNQGSVQAPKQRIPRNKPPKVLCTVDLGVKRVTNPTKPGERNDGRLEEVIMERAVVIFESEAEALCQ